MGVRQEGGRSALNIASAIIRKHIAGVTSGPQPLFEPSTGPVEIQGTYRGRNRRKAMLNIDARNPDAITIFNVLPKPDTEAFLRDLSDLSRCHGIALSGNPTLFVMERDDYQFDYRADDESVLSFG